MAFRPSSRTINLDSLGSSEHQLRKPLRVVIENRAPRTFVAYEEEIGLLTRGQGRDSARAIAELQEDIINSYELVIRERANLVGYAKHVGKKLEEYVKKIR